MLAKLDDAEETINTLLALHTTALTRAREEAQKRCLAIAIREQEYRDARAKDVTGLMHFISNRLGHDLPGSLLTI